MIIQESIPTPEQQPATPKSRVADDEKYVLNNIRAIIRASDIHSKKLHKLTGLTTAQALILRSIEEMGEVTTRVLSESVSLSQATVTAVLDRLEAKNLLERYRSSRDRRIVHTRLTKEGQRFSGSIPGLLDEKFMARFESLPEKRRKEISFALFEVARMMNAGATDAVPTVNGYEENRTKREQA